MSRKIKRNWWRISGKELFLGGLALVMTVAVICMTGILSFYLVREFTLSGFSLGNLNKPEFVDGETSQTESMSPSSPTGIAPQVEIDPTLTPWDGIGRVTVLVLGLDYRDWAARNDYARSDTMILLTLDPLNRTAGVLSIPRDLWVSIPGFKHGKINTAYYLGDAYKIPGGGPGLAVKTVEQFLGVPINYYAQVDFSAFIRFIDEIGGVKIDVPEPITIDMLGSGAATKKTLRPGVQVLPGAWALAYARARYTEGGDFDRAERQQQVILAIRDRILSFDMLPILVSKASVLYQELASGVRTNLTLDQIIKLGLLASQVPEENIKRGVISEKFVLFGKSPDELAILIPVIDKIHVLRDEIFTTSGALGPLTPGDASERTKAENARISIQDGSQSGNLGSNTSQYLGSLGFKVAEVTGYHQQVTLTTLVDHTGKPHSTAYLVDLLGISENNIKFEYDPGNPVDIELILGLDWARNNNLP